MAGPVDEEGGAFRATLPHGAVGGPRAKANRLRRRDTALRIALAAVGVLALLGATIVLASPGGVRPPTAAEIAANQPEEPATDTPAPRSRRGAPSPRASAAPDPDSSAAPGQDPVAGEAAAALTTDPAAAGSPERKAVRITGSATPAGAKRVVTVEPRKRVVVAPAPAAAGEDVVAVAPAPAGSAAAAQPEVPTPAAAQPAAAAAPEPAAPQVAPDAPAASVAPAPTAPGTMTEGAVPGATLVTAETRAALAAAAAAALRAPLSLIQERLAAGPPFMPGGRAPGGGAPATPAPTPSAPPVPPVPAASPAPSAVTPPAVAAVLVEAEGGALEGGVELAQAEGASGGRAIGVPEGQPEEGSSTLVLDVPANGTYLLWGRVRAPDDGSNSFFVSVDGGSETLWKMPSGASWSWYGVKAEEAPEPVAYWLGAGQHRVEVRAREDGTLLDTVALLPRGSAPPS